QSLVQYRFERRRLGEVRNETAAPNEGRGKVDVGIILKQPIGRHRIRQGKLLPIAEAERISLIQRSVEDDLFSRAVEIPEFGLACAVEKWKARLLDKLNLVRPGLRHIEGNRLDDGIR